MDQQNLLSLGIGLLSLGLVLAGALLFWMQWQRAKAQKTLQRVLERGFAPASANGSSGEASPEREAEGSWREPDLPRHWLEGRMGQMLVQDEDRRLIEQCGFPSVKAQLLFLEVRVGLAIGLPVLYMLLTVASGGMRLLIVAVLLTLGFLAPKWFLSWYASQRKRRVVHELPLFVDLIRLLQGVGLSLDQSLQVIASDFRDVLKVLGHEVAIANRQYSQGRSREHSLQRLAQLHDNEGMSNLVSLLVQVDRHGGAVQEPLRQFSERLRERRRAELKEHIGKVTVKMTGVMVTTLLPALIIVTAGPGFLAVIRALGSMSR